MMKVLIAGAAGSIGLHVVNIVLSQGYQARAIVRTPQKDALLPVVWKLSMPMCRQMVCPPDTSIRCAVTQRLSSRSRLATIGPISSGTPTRPSAVIAANCALTSALSRTSPPPKSVSIAPGAIVLTVMPRQPNSRAM
ncbi:NmrA family NAD(P)-binding protein [Salmonella enterica]|nr:hypothetical protein [Salmonella enterica subsp. VII str. CFSAN000550]EDT6885051.1 hypothetical protein [Salmonella enterica subsp. enterica]EDU7898925.1 hypothetical protein [Salmonella enterica subsp. houtenae]EEO7409698.1 NmrA family NAD(P)-binding protein [Salmonella enterica]